MSTLVQSHLPLEWTAADMREHLGGIPLERIRMVPPPGIATEKDVIDIKARTGRICELVDGVLVEKTMGYYESRVALALAIILDAFVKKHGLGSVAGADGALRILPGLVRIPDVSFVRWQRLPSREVPREPIPAVAPDLAVEILSEGNTPGEMQRKLHDYFGAGSRLVWYIDPRSRIARVYTAPDQWTLLDEDGSLQGGQVLPGFELRLKDLLAQADYADQG